MMQFGCKHCNNTGYYDRIGIFEVLDLLQAKEDVLKNINDLKVQKEKLLQLFDEFEALIKEKRKIIIKQTEPTKHRYKKEE